MKKKIMATIFILVGIFIATFIPYNTITDYIAYNKGQTITVYGSIMTWVFDTFGPLAYTIIFVTMGIGFGILCIVGGIITLRQPKPVAAE